MKFLYFIFIFVITSASASVYNGKLASAKCDLVLHKNINICYSIADKGPDFVEYTLNGKFYNFKRVRFYKSHLIPYQYQASPRDYSHSGYDRGHIMSNKSATSSKELVKSSFAMTNIAPQRPYFNRYVWIYLERAERKFSRIYGKVNVVAGVIYSNKTLKIGSVHLPSYWYKIINIPSKHLTLYYLFPAEYDYKTPYDCEIFRTTKNNLVHTINFKSNILFKLHQRGMM